ncbi:hypothetical protein ACPCTH_33500 [Streptomyces cellulosae]
MAYCAPHGIPYSVFMGRQVKPGQAEWTEEDTALAVEWQRMQDEKCRGCGQPVTESLDDAGGYETELVRCFACQALEERRAELAKEERPLHGVKTVVRHLPPEVNPH